MGIPATIGRHRVWGEGDLVGVHWDGPISRDDVAAMRAMLAAINAEHGGSYMVSDMTRCTAFEPGARKYLAEWSREGTDKVNGTAVVGVNFAMRTLVTLAIKAAKFISGDKPGDMVFVKDEPEALRWIAARRIELAGTG